jgi:acetyl esterase/lipase
VWYAVGTDDVRIDQTYNQALAMAKLTDTFNASNFSFHMKQGGRHDFNAVWEFVYNALPQFFPSEQQDMNQTYYIRQTRIGDVMNDAVFGSYGRLIFPVDEGYWSGTTLEDLDLVWYNYIDPDKTVEVCNYLRAHASDCFIDIYTEAEKQADPEKRNTGLFFFRGNAGQPFAICNAGGGMAYVGAMHDSFPHALELSKQGYNAFALIYRPGWTTATEDLARAIAYVHDHAEELGVRADGYSLWGGSAGARMAAALGNLSNLRYLTGRTDMPQAAAVVMQYTGYTTVSADDAPTYANCGTNDGIASWRTMQSRLENLSALGIPTEFHSYQGLPHGFGLGTGTVAEGWLTDAVRFWLSQIGETPSAILSTRADKRQDSTIYSLDGTRRNTLQKGINIVGGRKVLK